MSEDTPSTPQPPPSSSEHRHSLNGADDSVEARLDRIDTRLHRLEQSIERVTELLDRVPLVVAGLTDFADETIGDGGADVDERLQRLVRLADKLTRHEVLDGLEQLAEHGDKLQKLVALADAIPDTVATTVDVFDDLVARSQEKGIDFVEFGHHMSTAANRFAHFVQGPEFEAVLDSGILEPETLRIVGHAGDALAEACDEEEYEKMGFFGLLRVMRDDDVRRAIGFAAAFARRFGSEFDDNAPRRLPE